MSRRSRDWLPMVQPAPSSRRDEAPENATVPFKRQAWEREVTVPRVIAAQRRRAAVRSYRPHPPETPRRDAIHVAARSENSVLFSLNNLQAMAAQRVISRLPPPPRETGADTPQLGFQERALELANLESPLSPPLLLLPSTEREKRGAWFVPVMLCAGMALFWAVVTIAVVVNLREGGTVVVKTVGVRQGAPKVGEPVPSTPRAVALVAPSRRPEPRRVVRERMIATPLSEAAASPVVERRVDRRSTKKRRSRRWHRRRRARRRAALRRRRRALARRRAALRRAARTRRVAAARRSLISAPKAAVAEPAAQPVPQPAPVAAPAPSLDDLLDGAVTK